MMGNGVLWEPRASDIEQSQLYRFMQRINGSYGCELRDYSELHRWSVEHVPEFWKELWEYAEIVRSQDFTRVVDDPRKMPGARWFIDARLNYAENLLRRRDDHAAIIFRGEDRVKRTISYGELFDQVHRIAEGLRGIGVREGDRVAGVVPNMPEAVIAMLATVSLGAIWSSCSPDFGVKGVLDRFSQINPKVIFIADGYFFRGKVVDTKEKMKGIIERLPATERVVVITYTGRDVIAGIPKAMGWNELSRPPQQPMVFAQLPADHPLYIMYSSGTTGLPKSIVHSAGGTLLQHIKELMLHCNLTPEDRIFYFTTCGWMMWNWLVSALTQGATLICYDGNPFYPDAEALLTMADELDITIFGTSAKYIATLKDAGVVPRNISSFPAMRLITSTGSPLAEESFDYVYEDWKQDVQLASISGGTDIISCFVLGNPLTPVYRGEIQCKGLGMDVDCFDEQGRPLVDQQGELVCKAAFPSMPLCFWNDPDGEKYRSAYFETFPGIWHHGDYVLINSRGGIVIFGRSDATLNPGGVRIGTAEIYGVVEGLEEIDDAVVVGQRYQGDERMILFVKLREGEVLTEALRKKIMQHLRTQCSPRHVPAMILETPEIPYTLNGKKVEVAVKQIIHGQEVKNRDALANPQALEHYGNRRELQQS